MIQDISPHRYDNSFASRRSPEAADFVLLYRNGRVRAGQRETEAGTEIFFPTVEEFAGNVSWETGHSSYAKLKEGVAGREQDLEEDEWEKGDGYYTGENGAALRYLFSIDERAYYGADSWAEDSLLSERDGVPFSWISVRDLRACASGPAPFAGVTGSQLARWRNDRHYCGRCGSPMLPSDTERAFVCADCGAIVYPKISPAVIVGVRDGDRLLVSRYAGRAGGYSLIAGFAEVGESIEDTVRREVMEEVGLRVKNLRFYKSQPWSLTDTLLMGFFCELDGDGTIRLDESELALARWVTPGELPAPKSTASLTAEMIEVFRSGNMK